MILLGPSLVAGDSHETLVTSFRRGIQSARIGVACDAFAYQDALRRAEGCGAGLTVGQPRLQHCPRTSVRCAPPSSSELEFHRRRHEHAFCL
jgi:hypothetical protein